MEMQDCPGSKRVQPDKGSYLAIERAYHDSLASHPEGKAVPALRVVEGIDRGFYPALHPSPSTASATALSRPRW